MEVGDPLATATAAACLSTVALCWAKSTGMICGARRAAEAREEASPAGRVSIRALKAAISPGDTPLVPTGVMPA